MPRVNEHLWDFPHTMKLKVMGAVDAPLSDLVTDILRQHLGDFDPDKQLSISYSSSGNYVSLTANVVMENAKQVEAIYADLNASTHVKVVF